MDRTLVCSTLKTMCFVEVVLQPSNLVEHVGSQKYGVPSECSYYLLIYPDITFVKLFEIGGCPWTLFTILSD